MLFLLFDKMRTFLTLDFRALALAIVIGLIIFFAGGQMGWFFLAVILFFLVLSAVVTRIGKKRKVRLGVYEESRGWKNVISNGIVPVVIVALFAFYPESAGKAASYAIIAAYISSVAAITADKFSSELGVLGNAPRMIFTFRKVKRGVSGGVTGVGLAAGLIGAALISTFGVTSGIDFASLFAITTLSGLAGDIVDSAAGYFEEKGFGSKYTSNIAAAVAGAAIGGFLFLLIA